MKDFTSFENSYLTPVQTSPFIKKNPNLDNDDEPLIGYVNQLLIEAVDQTISDLHFEPHESFYRIRVRKDGILYEHRRLPLKLIPRLTSRLKIMAKLDISERRLPQDGRFKINDISKLKDIDFRVSCCPTLFGEKVVVRILPTFSQNNNLEALGFESFQKALLLECLQKPQGLILVTGPTGSGKTRSLYSALNILNRCHRNIISCEDPVEICVPGITQVNVNLKAGLTFANALRSFLRQDPDVIMIGEIRDAETAEIATKASETGHLVLSTLHTNSAAETINRLIHMGIPYYQLATSLTLIVAQRLIRILCSHCKILNQYPETIIPASYPSMEPSIIYSPNLQSTPSCPHCKFGYQGRTAIYECMPLSMDLQKMILNKASVLDLENQALQEGMWNLRTSAMNKVKQGITSLEEVFRVTV
jgi:type IV pilus assembly protein PilB